MTYIFLGECISVLFYQNYRHFSPFFTRDFVARAKIEQDFEYSIFRFSTRKNGEGQGERNSGSRPFSDYNYKLYGSDLSTAKCIADKHSFVFCTKIELFLILTGSALQRKAARVQETTILYNKVCSIHAIFINNT